MVLGTLSKNFSFSNCMLLVYKQYLIFLIVTLYSAILLYSPLNSYNVCVNSSVNNFILFWVLKLNQLR